MNDKIVCFSGKLNLYVCDRKIITAFGEFGVPGCDEKDKLLLEVYIHVLTVRGPVYNIIVILMS